MIISFQLARSYTKLAIYTCFQTLTKFRNRSLIFTLLSAKTFHFCRFHDQDLEEKLEYVANWTVSRIENGDKELMKPITFIEFGLSDLNNGFEPSQRDRFFKVIYDILYESARKKKSGAGSFVWQFLVGGMEEYNDDFGIVPWKRPSTYQLITGHSCRLAAVQGVLPSQKEHLKELCSKRR